MRKSTVIATASIATLIGVCGIGGCVSVVVASHADPTPSQTWTTYSPSPIQPAQTTKARSVAGIADGQYIIGKDVQPGRYKSAGPSDDSLGICYWDTSKDGTANTIVDQGVEKGQAYATLRPGQYFKTSGCNTWYKVA